MIRGIHYFSAEVKTKIDVIPRGCFNPQYMIVSVYIQSRIYQSADLVSAPTEAHKFESVNHIWYILELINTNIELK